jgi:hypothetical protein
MGRPYFAALSISLALLSGIHEMPDFMKMATQPKGLWLLNRG